MIDVSYRYAEKVLQGRRAIQNDETGEVEFVGDVADHIDLVAIRQKQLDEAFKPAGRKIDAEVMMPDVVESKPASTLRKPKASRSRPSEGDK